MLLPRCSAPPPSRDPPVCDFVAAIGAAPLCRVGGEGGRGGLGQARPGQARQGSLELGAPQPTSQLRARLLPRVPAAGGETGPSCASFFGAAAARDWAGVTGRAGRGGGGPGLLAHQADGPPSLAEPRPQSPPTALLGTGIGGFPAASVAGWPRREPAARNAPPPRRLLQPLVRARASPARPPSKPLAGAKLASPDRV